MEFEPSTQLSIESFKQMNINNTFEDKHKLHLQPFSNLDYPTIMKTSTTNHPFILHVLVTLTVVAGGIEIQEKTQFFRPGGAFIDLRSDHSFDVAHSLLKGEELPNLPYGVFTIRFPHQAAAKQFIAHINPTQHCNTLKSCLAKIGNPL